MVDKHSGVLYKRLILLMKRVILDIDTNDMTLDLANDLAARNKSAIRPDDMSMMESLEKKYENNNTYIKVKTRCLFF